MSDMQRASKAFFKSTEPDTGVFPTRSASGAGREPVRTPMRPTSGFSPVSGDVKKTSWDEVSRERDPDGETKNYSVPPELIELARRAKKGRAEVGTLTPLAPKPAQEVVVVVPAAKPLGLDMRDGAAPASSPQAPSVPIQAEQAQPEPDSQPTVVFSEAAAKAAVSASVAPLLGDMSESERVSSESQPAPAESAMLHPSSSPRRSSRRARRSLRIEMPTDASAAAQAASAGARSRPYMQYAVGAALVGFYVVLSYYGSVLLGGLH